MGSLAGRSTKPIIVGRLRWLEDILMRSRLVDRYSVSHGRVSRCVVMAVRTIVAAIRYVVVWIPILAIVPARPLLLLHLTRGIHGA